MVMSNKIPYLLKRPDKNADKISITEKDATVKSKQPIVIKNRKIAALLQRK
jgi:hypothetical protein